MENLLESDRIISGKRFESLSHSLYTERDSLIVRPVSTVCLSDSDDMMTVMGEGIYNMNGVKWQVKVVERTSDFNLKQPVGTVIMDADKMAFPFVCRPWRHGDWFVPFGMSGRKKVGDFLTDTKVSAPERKRQFVLLSGEDIVWVVGRRIDDRYALTSKSENVLKIVREII